MSKNFFIILTFLISGIIFGIMGTKLFLIPLIWLPIFIFKILKIPLLVIFFFLMFAWVWSMPFWLGWFAIFIYFFAFILVLMSIVWSMIK